MATSPDGSPFRPPAGPDPAADRLLFHRLTQAAVERSQDAVFWTLLDGRIFHVNDQACRGLGYTRAELTRMQVWDIDPCITADDWPGLAAGLRESESSRLETLHRRKDGSVFPVEIMAHYIRHEGREYNIAFARDLTEVKKAHAQLRESEERLCQAVRVAYTGIFDHDHTSGALYWSPELRALYGVGADDPVSIESIGSIVHKDDREMVLAAIRQANDPAGDGLLDVQHRIVRPDGAIRWMLGRARTTFEGEGTERRPVRCVGAVMDITDRVDTERKVAYLAFYDSLTGLANRRLLRDRMDRALAVSARNHLFGALLFIDLDHFKTINDTVGHDYGDLLLQEVARRLQGVLRESDTVSRPGGDEFVVMMEEVSPDRAAAAALVQSVSEKIIAALSRPCSLNGREYSGSASIGMVLFRGHEDSIDELLKRSDMAMYAAKRAGRGVACFFDPHMQAALERRAEVEGEMHRAIERGQLRLYYQPRVDCDGRIVGAEALLRWMHPRRGLVLPGEFIPVCEESGLITAVGEWVLRTGCDQLKRWEADPALRHLKLSVNISGKQFRQDGFVDQVMAALQATGIDPARLELELTENLFAENAELCIAKMRVLRGAGVAFSLDDFGTGYSSLSYLRKLPLSQLKIDQSFVRDIAVDASDEVIVQTIIKMGQTLGLEVVAEGVEAEDQRRRLELHGCRNFQGYLFGPPMPAREFEDAVYAGVPDCV